LYFVEADSIDQVLRAQHPQELAHVEFGNKNRFVSLEHIPEVCRQRIEIAQVNVPDFAATLAMSLHRGCDSAVRRAPSNDQKITFSIPDGNHIGDVLYDGRNFCRADAHHVLVVERLVVDVAGNILLLEAADAVLEARRAGNGPRAPKRLRVALVRQVDSWTIGFRLK